MFSRIAAALLALNLPAAHAFVISGNLNDPTNTALIGSDPWTGGPPPVPPAALFGSDYDIANNVALHTFSVAAADNFIFDSNGFAAGGADPYFTLFAGSGAGATVLASNFLQASCLDPALPCGGDFLISQMLAAGDYSIAMGVFGNMSFAENAGAGTLGDGFTALGGPAFLGNSFYELSVEPGTPPPPPPPLPLPATLLLLAVGAAALAMSRRTARV